MLNCLMRARFSVALFFIFLFVSVAKAEQEFPKLNITAGQISEILAAGDLGVTFTESLASAKELVEASMSQGVNVPIPADAGGGFTHEQHKRNYQAVYLSGLMFQLTREQRYLDHALALFAEYAALYPTLGEHPKKKEQSPGRLFWQNLNEAVWLVHMAQGYDLIVGHITDENRALIENRVLRPAAKFLSEESPETFNKIHNHGTWAAAAVGMTGYVLNDQDLVEKSLTGLDKSGRYGFLKQLDELFSPDGYYTEGPYYQRYALMPFVLFAKAIENNEPSRKIFEYRDGILLKAIYATIDSSYNGLFFPINDAIKDKGLATSELVWAVAIAYGLTGDTQLLGLSQSQGRVSLTGDGFKMAQAIDKGQAKPYQFKTTEFRDGADGKAGALSVFRFGDGEDHQALVVKNTSQGMGHGHFDRLSWLFYDNGEEIVRDYGAARFLNVESKYGGHYLPENKTYAKQTVAHNTLVLEGESHFGGDWRLGQKTAPEVLFSQMGADLSVTSAVEKNAYKSAVLHRTMALVKVPDLEFPIVVDVFDVKSSRQMRMDLPVHFTGHLTDHNLELAASDTSREPLGTDNGYQHLWDVAQGSTTQPNSQVTWIKGDRFYTLSSVMHEDDQILFAQVGANDPNFNLRNEDAVIHRSEAVNRKFVSILEPHGEYNGTLEFTKQSHSQVKAVSSLEAKNVDAVHIQLTNGQAYLLLISTTSGENQFSYQGKLLSWTGHATLKKL